MEMDTKNLKCTVMIQNLPEKQKLYLSAESLMSASLRQYELIYRRWQRTAYSTDPYNSHIPDVVRPSISIGQPMTPPLLNFNSIFVAHRTFHTHCAFPAPFLRLSRSFPAIRRRQTRMQGRKGSLAASALSVSIADEVTLEYYRKPPSKLFT